MLTLFFLACSLFIISCSPDEDIEPTATCTDGIQNQNETGVDCGGTCDPCIVANCTDGIQNQDETGVDCGGSCAPCPTSFSERMTANLNGQAFAANLVAGFDDGSNIQVNSDQSQAKQIELNFPSGVTVGTYNLSTAGFSADFVDFPDSYVTQSGTVTITSNVLDAGTLGGSSYDELSGTFEFTTVLFSSGNPIDTVVVTNGDFGVEVF